MLAAVIAAAAVGAAACGAANQAGTVSAAAAGQAGAAVPLGMAVTCGPGQRAIVRPQLIDGQPVTAVECAAAGTSVAAAARPASGAWQPYGGGADADVPAPSSASLAARPASYRVDGDVLTYQPRARRPVRTVQKSTLIIGSSAGIGAGVGAAVGGKRGALIGAAIGGGGATLWDQVTRRR